MLNCLQQIRIYNLCLNLSKIILDWLLFEMDGTFRRVQRIILIYHLTFVIILLRVNRFWGIINFELLLAIKNWIACNQFLLTPLILGLRLRFKLIGLFFLLILLLNSFFILVVIEHFETKMVVGGILFGFVFFF